MRLMPFSSFLPFNTIVMRVQARSNLKIYIATLSTKVMLLDQGVPFALSACKYHLRDVFCFAVAAHKKPNEYFVYDMIGLLLWIGCAVKGRLCVRIINTIKAYCTVFACVCASYAYNRFVSCVCCVTLGDFPSDDRSGIAPGCNVMSCGLRSYRLTRERLLECIRWVATLYTAKMVCIAMK
jgi:hypothetical protein